MWGRQDPGIAMGGRDKGKEEVRNFKMLRKVEKNDTTEQFDSGLEYQLESQTI